MSTDSSIQRRETARKIVLECSNLLARHEARQRDVLVQQTNQFGTPCRALILRAGNLARQKETGEKDQERVLKHAAFLSLGRNREPSTVA